MKISRLIAWCGLSLATFIIVFFGWLVFPVLTDPSRHFMERKGTLSFVEQERIFPFGDSTITETTLHSSSGLTVKLSYRIPLDKTKKYPLVLLLGGHKTGRNAVRLVPARQDMVIAAISYPYNAPAKVTGLDLLRYLRVYQAAFRDTPPAVMLALDYLLSQAVVDEQQIEAVGVSLGAFLITSPVAMDERVKRLWLVHGAAIPDVVIEHNIRQRFHNGLVRVMMAKLLTILSSGHYLKAERWLPLISPRPVIAINSRQDERLPFHTVTALHRALVQPAEIIWIEGQHITPGREAVVQQISEIILKRIATESKLKVLDSVAK